MNVLNKFFLCFDKFRLQKKAVIVSSSMLLFFIPCFFVQAWTISPPAFDLVGVPGQTIHGKYMVINKKYETTKTFYISLKNFAKEHDDQYATFAVSNSNKGLSTWVLTEKEVTLAQGEKVELEYTVVIPSDADPGEYYAAIIWSTERLIDDDKVNAEFTILIELQVTGEVKEVDSFETIPLRNLSSSEKQKILDKLYNYVEKTGSNVAYTKLKMLEKKFGLKKSYNRLRPSSYTIRKALYGPIGSMMLDGSDIEDELDFLTGARAADETLQLGSINDRDRGDTESDRTINISNVSRLQIKSHPWEEMLEEHKTPEFSSIFKLVPEDHFVVRFDEMGDFSRLEDALKELLSFGDYFFDISDLLNIKQTIVERLGIEDLEKFESLVGEFAFVSEDLSFVPRTNYALVLKFDSDIASKMASYLVPDTSVHGAVGDYYVISSSQNLFDSIEDSFEGKRATMYDAKDFVYASAVLDDRRDGIVYFSEEFILKLVSPEYRINAGRRNLALQKLDALQYTVLAYRSITGHWPDTLQQIADEGYINSAEKGFTVDDDGRVRHKDWGTLYDITAIGDVSIEKVTKQEKELYEDFREDYERYWREYFDPIGIAIKASDQLYFHTIILPLIDESIYNGVKAFVGDNKKQFDGVTQPLHSSPLLFLSHLGFDDFLVETIGFKMYGSGSYFSFASATSNLNSIRWRAELYYDDNSGYGTALSCNEGVFAEENIRNVISDVKDLETVEDVICRADNNEYIVSAKFKNFDLEYCIDSTGAYSYVTERSETMQCGTEKQMDWREMREMIEEKQRQEWDSFSYEEKKEKVNESVSEEFLNEVGFEEGFDIFGIIGDELQVGVGESIPYEIENIADTDAYIGIKLNDQDRAEEFINTVYSAFAEEYGGHNVFGFFKFSSKHPIKNTYNDVEFYMIPTGFINLYYLYQGDYIYFTISQDVINNLIDGTQTKESVRLTSIQERFSDYIGDEHSMLLLADVTPFASYKEGLLDQALQPTYSTKRQSQYLYAHVSDLQFLQKVLSEDPEPTSFDEAAQYMVNVPEKFLGIPIKVTSDDVLFGSEKYSYSDINFGRDYSYGYRNEGGGSVMSFDELFTEEDRQKILSGWDAFTGFAVGLAFTKEGLDTKVAINNPLMDESESDILRESGAGKNDEIMMYLLYGLVLLTVLSVSIVIVVLVKKKHRAEKISEAKNNRYEAAKGQVKDKTDVVQQTSSTSTIHTKEVPINKALLDYIQEVLAAGDSTEKIRATLLQSGWNEQDVQQAFDYLKIDQKKTGE